MTTSNKGWVTRWRRRLGYTLVQGMLAASGGLIQAGDPPPEPTSTAPAPTPEASVGTMAPNTGPATTEVTLTGTGLDRVTGVTYAGMPLDPGAFHVDSPVQIRVRVPWRATATGTFTLTSPAGSLTSPVFTVTFQVPAITGLSATSGRVVSRVVLTGTHLASATRVDFGGTPAVAFDVLADDRIEATVPPRAYTGLIKVTTRGGSASSAPFAVLPVLEAFAPLGGAPGTVVSLRGSGLERVNGKTWIQISGRWVEALGVNGDRTELRVAIPAGAAAGSTGPITLVTPGGRVASTAAFTLNYLAPALSAMDPKHGVPGTEVIFTGANLAGVTQVLYGGVALDPGTWKVDPETGRLKAQVPRGGGNGVFTLRNPAGGSVDSDPFTATPVLVRPDFLAQPVVQHAALGTPALDYPAVNRSLQYGLGWAKAPMFHAYHPMQPEDPAGRLRPGHDDPVKVCLSLALPDCFREALPVPVRMALAALPNPAAPLELQIVSQNQPYAAPMLFRPHYWLYPDTAQLGLPAEDRARRSRMQLFSDPEEKNPVHFEGREAGAPLTGEPTGTSVHALAPGSGLPSAMINSPNNLRVAGLDPTVTQAVWSLVQDDTHPVHPGRTAVTLHLILNDAAQAALEALIPGVLTFRDLLEGMEHDHVLAGTPATANLRQLLGPVPAEAVAAVPVPPEPVAPVPVANLWPVATGAAPGSLTLTVPAGGWTAQRQLVDCAPGDRFSGTCQARTLNMTAGNAHLGIRFDSATGEVLGWASPDTGGRLSTTNTAWSPLAAVATAPAGTVRAHLYVECGPCNPEAQGIFQDLTFVRTFSAPPPR